MAQPRGSHSPPQPAETVQPPHFTVDVVFTSASSPPDTGPPPYGHEQPVAQNPQLPWFQEP